MNRKTTLFFVALGAFALGMAVDRLLLSSGDAASASHPGKSDSLASGGSARGPARSTRLRGSHERERPPGEGRTDRAREERPDAGEREEEIPASVRRVLEGLERGERMDAATASAVLAKVPAGRHRHGVLEHLASHWARQDPEAAVEWAEELQGIERWWALEGILHGWAETDPAGAADYVARLPNSEHSLHLVRGVAHHWAERDREAALEWAAGQEDPATRRHALGGVVEFWAHDDPAEAAVFAASLDGPYERLGALEVAARRWASRSSADAMEWARELPAGDRQRATVAILHEVAERDPGRAAAMYDELTAGLPAESLHGEAYRRMAQEIASVWSSSSPQEAAAWALQLPEAGEVRRGAVADVAEHWLRIDSMAAGEWILQLPEGRTRDAATERVVGTFVHSDPASAFAWASSASDEGHRFGMMREVLKRWQVRDPAAAQAALHSAEVSAEQRRELNDVFERAVLVPQNPPPGQEVEEGAPE